MTLITDSAEVASLCRRLTRTEYVTVDTEFMRERTFWPKLCLVQLAGPTEAAAIDPLADDIDLDPVLRLLANKRVLKVLHGARQDIEIFYHLTGSIPTPLYDTQIAAMVCGFGDQVGYETLVSRLTSHRLDKSSRFTDWSARPLTAKQLNYALGDVIYLRDAYEALNKRIEGDDRAGWLEEEHAALTNVNSYSIDPSAAWQRLKPRSTDRRYLTVLRAAASWREDEAMRRDVPRNRVIRDEALTEIAAHPPTTVAALARIRGVTRGFAEGRSGKTLIAAIVEATALPPEEGPQPLKHVSLPRGLAPMVDLLRVLLKQRCEQHGVAQKLVANTQDLERVATGSTDVPALQGWRLRLFGEDALRVKRGQAALAVRGSEVHLVPVNGGGTVDMPAAAESEPRPRRRRRRPEAARNKPDSGI